MSLITGFLDLSAPIAGRLFASPLWTPATALAVTAEVLWLANALALLFWLARPARPQAPPREPPRNGFADGSQARDDLLLAA